MSILCRVDDKLIPLYRVMWVAAAPHFCGEDDCIREGSYEVRLEQGESVWATVKEHDELTRRLEQWQGGLDPSDDETGESGW